eukprot:m.206812 g.206812  ORF g.206812 m.206812 type:complete len:812 (-) comp32969_c3_seq2:226-2661(-)
MGCCGSSASKQKDEDGDAELPTYKSIDRKGSEVVVGPKPSTYTGKYLGRVTVQKADGNDVVRNAHARLSREYADKVLNVKVSISVESITTIAGKNNVVQDNMIKEISFCSLNQRDPKSVAFITSDRNGVSFCHFYKIGEAKNMHVAIGAAFKAAIAADKKAEEKDEMIQGNTAEYARRTTSLSKPDIGGLPNAADVAGDIDDVVDENEEKQPNGKPQNQAEPKKKAAPVTKNAVQSGRDLSEVLGTFEVMFMGTVSCTEMRGQHVIVQKLNDIMKLGKTKHQVVALQVSGEGIKCIDILTSQPVSMSSMLAVSFTTTITDKSVLKSSGLKALSKEWSGSVFAYILKDERLSRITCSIYACRTLKAAADIAQAVNKAFQVQVEIKKLRQGNPFAAISSARDTVPSSLFGVQIHRADVEARKVIGMGQFGEVYLATQNVRPELRNPDLPGNRREIAVKILRKSASPSDRLEFLRESEVMIALKHANLVQLVGVSVQQRPWLSVLEFVKYGDLLSIAKTCQEKKFEIGYREHLLMGQQMAAGMDYIAKRNMIHMDLAARNVLLGRNNVVKIADFGLTRKLSPGKNYYRLMVTLKLPIKWMALESIKDKIFTVKTDVWGFGIMVWEVLSYGEIPYGDVKNIEVEKHVADGNRLSCCKGCPQVYHDLLSTCWLKNPGQRPDFEVLELKIRNLDGQARGKYPDPRPDVGAALHDEAPQQQLQKTPAAPTSTKEQEFVIQDMGAAQWKKQKSTTTAVNAPTTTKREEESDDDLDDTSSDEDDVPVIDVASNADFDGFDKPSSMNMHEVHDDDLEEEEC